MTCSGSGVVLHYFSNPARSGAGFELINLARAGFGKLESSMSLIVNALQVMYEFSLRKLKNSNVFHICAYVLVRVLLIILSNWNIFVVFKVCNKYASMLCF